MSEVTTVDTQTFDEVVLQSDVPVLVDFWAPGAARAVQSRRSWTRLPPSRMESFSSPSSMSTRTPTSPRATTSVRSLR